MRDEVRREAERPGERGRLEEEEGQRRKGRRGRVKDRGWKREGEGGQYEC